MRISEADKLLIWALGRAAIVAAAIFATAVFAEWAAANPVVRIHNQLPGGVSNVGSGTLVHAANGRGLVLTCAHLFTEGVGQVVVTDERGNRHGALVVGRDSAADLAGLEIAEPKVEPAPVVLAIDPASQLVPAGYGGDGVFRSFAGGVTGYSDGPGQTSVRVAGEVRSGDSGGGVFDANRHLVAVVWGAAQGETYASTGEPLRRFVERMGLTPVAQTQYPGTVCYGGSCSPCAGGQCPPSRPAVLPGVRYVAPRQTAPVAATPAPSGAACDCSKTCEPQLKALADRLAVVEAREPVAGPPGPAGPKGDPGADGKAATVDENAIAERVAAIVLAQQPKPAGVSHYVLVADESASYWPRLSDEYRRAKEAYSQVRLSGVPNVPVGALPQLVAYRDGKPLGAFKGASDVSNALARISRNEPPQP